MPSKPLVAPITGVQIVAEARTWLGTPYVDRGRERGKEADCVGLIIGVGTALQQGQYLRRDYTRNPDPVRMGRDLMANLDEVSKSAPRRLGDILWFKIRKQPTHLALLGDYVYGGFSLIHAYTTAGAVVEHRFDDKWQAKLYRVFRYKGVGVR